MLQQEQAEDFVIATGVQFSVRDFIVKSAMELGIELAFSGAELDEFAVVSKVTGDRAPGVKPGDIIVRVDPRYFRPAEVDTLLGDPSKAAKKLGWKPEISLDEMIREMVAYDLDQARRSALLKKHGYSVSVPQE